MTKTKTGITIKGKHFYLNGKRVRLAGNHTWNTVQPMNGERIGMDKITGNFTRLWTIETKGAEFGKSHWGSNSPGLVKIGNNPWKDDGSLNKKFYKNLENSVKQAQKRDIVTGVVLFEGSIQDIFSKAWENHPFNGLGPKTHNEVHTKGPWNKFQRAHVKKVVETLAPYDNVMYEVGNELMSPSTKWFQKKVVKWIKKWTDKPVGVSYARTIRASKGRDEYGWMRKTGADWFAPSATAISKGQFSSFKGPVVLDTDHSWPMQSRVSSLQSYWDKGHNILVMDGFNGTMLKNQGNLTPDRNWINSVV